eukprot:3472315-Pleurochrysis_carterae.AAC.5
MPEQERTVQAHLSDRRYARGLLLPSPLVSLALQLAAGEKVLPKAGPVLRRVLVGPAAVEILAFLNVALKKDTENALTDK